jgi:hypothetical protein
MEATPFEHVDVAVATKLVGELTVLLFAGEVTLTPDDDDPVTVIVIEVVPAPPQLSQSSTIVL